MAQGKYWCFTWNNPKKTPIEVIDLLKSLKDFNYSVFQTESGDNGTRHYQGYLEFTTLKRLTQLKKVDSTVHWERRRGTQQQAIEYCKKSDTRLDGPYEAGHPSETQQGARTDLSDAITVFRVGGLDALVEQHPEVFVKYHRGFSALLARRKLPRRVPDVILLIGPPGTGKTRFAYEADPDLWALPIGDQLWFDGYEDQSTALIDDFNGRASKLRLDSLLRILDRYRLQTPVKGGHTWWNPATIYITTNTHPHYWYDYSTRSKDYIALQRRFAAVVQFNDDGTTIRSARPDLPAIADLVTDQQDNKVKWDTFWDSY